MDPNDTLRAMRNYCDRAIRPGLSVSERVRALEAVAAEFRDLDLFLLDKDNPLPEDWAHPQKAQGVTAAEMAEVMGRALGSVEVTYIVERVAENGERAIVDQATWRRPTA